MIINPTNIEVDPRGRVWATECTNYRKYMEQRPEGDRVVILEDTNGDGVADKEKTFFQSKELTNPLGICVLPQAKGTKVIVSAAPNIWLLTDTDGDDVADDAKIISRSRRLELRPPNPRLHLRPRRQILFQTPAIPSPN